MRYFYVAFLFFLMPFSRVFAIDVTRVYIPDVEYYKTINGVVHHGAFPMFTIDNEVLYCIEPGIPINSLSYQITNDYSLSSMIKYELELIAYYGYSYPSHQSDLYLMATQKLIWETLGSTDVYFKSTITNSVIPLDSYVGDIKRLISSYYNKPSFDNVTISGFINSEFSLYDYNNEISKYKLINSGGNDAGISTNNLNIKLLSDNDILLSKNNGSNTTIYANDTSQKLASFGLSNDISDTRINVNILYGTINLTVKYDDDIPLNDIVYEVTNNTGFIKRLKTDINGKASVAELNQGTYEIRQITPLKRHRRDDNVYYAYVNNKNLVNNILMATSIDLKTLTINKFIEDISTNTRNMQPNISFGIYENDVLIETLATPEGGTVITKLPYGEYKIKQLTKVDGYSTPSDTVLIINDKSSDDIILNLYSYIDNLPNTNSDNKIYSYFIILLIGVVLFFKRKKL